MKGYDQIDDDANSKNYDIALALISQRINKDQNFDEKHGIILIHQS